MWVCLDREAGTGPQPALGSLSPAYKGAELEAVIHSGNSYLGLTLARRHGCTTRLVQVTPGETPGGTGTGFLSRESVMFSALIPGIWGEVLKAPPALGQQRPQQDFLRTATICLAPASPTHSCQLTRFLWWPQFSYKRNGSREKPAQKLGAEPDLNPNNMPGSRAGTSFHPKHDFAPCLTH